MNTYVLDSRIAAKWFLPDVSDALSNDAWKLLERYRTGEVRLLVPDLFWTEFADIDVFI